MESRLPKPSALKKPTTVFKAILPTDRIKSNSFTLKSSLNFDRFPLTTDLSNLCTITRPGGVHTADEGRSSIAPRPKLRRSRSACDLNADIQPSFKKLGVAPKGILPANKIRSNSLFTRNLDLLGSRPATANGIRKTPDPENAPVASSRPKLRRSRSACDLRNGPSSSRNLKRTEPTLAPIPSKTLKVSNGVSSLSSHKPKAAVGSGTTSRTTNTSANAKTAAAKRIPAYDYKARFNDLMEKHKVLKEKFDEAKEQLASFENLPEQYEEAQNELYNIKQELKNAKTEIECLQRQTRSQSIRLESLSKCLHDTKVELQEVTEKYQIMSKEQESMSTELTSLRQRCVELTERDKILSSELELCKDQLIRANNERKELHNTIMDLRGNIRVFCRVRPPLDSEGDRLLCGWNYLDEASLEITNIELLTSGAKNKVANHTFSFDHVFHPRSTQEDIFEMVSPLIQSALDGYNICIFAYGQTGSGKTFTMDGTAENVGVIPRTVDLLFSSIKNYKHLGWEYKIKVTFLEIYNEVLYDLLSNEQKDMEIKMAKNKTDIYVSNITEQTVDTANQLRHLMQIAKMNRATASTAGNERSSRSHAVTKIELIGRHIEKDELSVGTINLVDLAGSESPKTSTRMNETKNINRSLSELTNVILALLQKQDHIPYRNSKLTHLLMPSLGGNSKTLMFINVAPFQDCYVESVKSLRFASSVNACKMAKAKKNRILNTSNSSLL